MRIEAAHQTFQLRQNFNGNYREWVTKILSDKHQFTIVWNVDAEAEPVVGFINAGKWVAKCAVSGASTACTGFMLATYIDPVWFCDVCGNAAWGNRPRRVEFPSNEDRIEIEAILMARPVEHLRNYRPWDGDTIKGLYKENIEMPWLEEN